MQAGKPMRHSLVWWLSIRGMVAAFMISVMAGCALWQSATPTIHPPGTGEALVVVYRLPLISGHFWDTAVSVDGSPQADLNDKEYRPLYVAAGSHVFTAKFPHEKPLQVQQNLKAGGTYYLELSQEIIGKDRVRHVMQFVPEHSGKAFLEAL